MWRQVRLKTMRDLKKLVIAHYDGLIDVLLHMQIQRHAIFSASYKGGLDVSPGDLRDVCVEGLVERNLPGYAIGGLAGGEDKNAF